MSVSLLYLVGFVYFTTDQFAEFDDDFPEMTEGGRLFIALVSGALWPIIAMSVVVGEIMDWSRK